MCADLSDVSNALVTLAAGALSLNGSGFSSSLSANVRVFPGWPIPDAIDADMAAGAVNVSIFPQEAMERVTTRYPQQWVETTRQTPTLTATVSGATVTLGGTVTAGNYVTVVAGNDQAQSYALVAGDTLTSAAASLAALFGAMGVTSSGAVLTFPAVYNGRLTACIAAPSTVVKELKRQQRAFMITVWAPTPTLRDAAGSILDAAFAATDFLTMPDLTTAWLTYLRQNNIDREQTRVIYRRDLVYWAEYATTASMAGAPITNVSTGLEVDPIGTVFQPLPWGSFTPIATNID